MKNLEDECKKMITCHEYKKCENKIKEAMFQDPHSAIPHNLMGILMEKEKNHVQAMKHFRAAYALDPTYIPARYNMEQYGSMNFTVECAYSEKDCQIQKDSQFKEVYDAHNVRHLIRK